MHILLAHNDYGKFSGEEHAVQTIAGVLEGAGHRVSWLRPSSEAIGNLAMRKAEAFFSGIYSRRARQQIAAMLDRDHFDLVQVQNLYPFLSPSILPVCKERGLPVVMRCPNYRLFCPNGLHMTKGQVCERCLGGREWHCVVQNCEGERFKSLGYAVRNAFARLTGMIRDNVSVFIVQSEFQKRRFIAGGIAAERIDILPNIAPEVAAPADDDPGDLITFAGRLSEEKGIGEFVDAARKLPELRFAVAGTVDDMPGVVAAAPPNVTFAGFITGAELDAFFRRTRVFVCPSKWFEGFPNVIAQAMAYGKPVIGTRIGAIPEIVDDGVTGLLAEPGDAGDLAERIAFLSARPQLCREMGEAGYRKARAQYSHAAFAERLAAIHRHALRMNGFGVNGSAAGGEPAATAS